MSGCPFGSGAGPQAEPGRITSYGDALNVTQLLQLQRPFSSESPHHDELQYAIIHQVSELWFKLLLHELDAVGLGLRTGDLRGAARLLRRSIKILQQVDDAFGLMETMTAYDYAAFRPSLVGGSGFQSAQFRELEIALGCHREFTLEQAAFTDEERARLGRRLAQPNLWDSFVIAMRHAGWAMPARPESASDPELRAQGTAHLREMYLGGSNPDLREVSEELAAFDSLMLIWRTHHAVMAERAIGDKVGTGGEGVRYLYETARIRCFPELIAMRSEI